MYDTSNHTQISDKRGVKDVYNELYLFKWIKNHNRIEHSLLLMSGLTSANSNDTQVRVVIPKTASVRG